MSWIHRLRLQHLQLLVDLADSGSMSRTAARMHTTQPGLSKWLKDLERDARAPLFERHARGLRPTLQGHLLLAHAQRVLNETARTIHDLESVREGFSLNIVIGTSPAAASTLIPAAVLRLRKRYSRARITIVENTMDVLLTRLRRGEMDVVAGRLDNYTLPPHLRYETLYSEPICIVTRPEHPLARRRKLQWKDLYAYDWIVWPIGTPIRSKLDATLTRLGLDHPPYRVESSSLMANFSLLYDSDMLSVASAHVARRYAGYGLLKVLPMDLGEQGSLGICWRDEPNGESGTPELLKCLRAAVADLT